MLTIIEAFVTDILNRLLDILVPDDMQRISARKHIKMIEGKLLFQPFLCIQGLRRSVIRAVHIRAEHINYTALNFMAAPSDIPVKESSVGNAFVIHLHNDTETLDIGASVSLP